MARWGGRGGLGLLGSPQGLGSLLGPGAGAVLHPISISGPGQVCEIRFWVWCRQAKPDEGKPVATPNSACSLPEATYLLNSLFGTPLSSSASQKLLNPLF